MSLWVGLIDYFVTVILTVVWLYRRGLLQGAQRHIKGDYLGSVDEVKQLICRNQKQSDLILGVERLPLPQFSEMQHFLFHGTTGSGKSTE